MSSLLWLLEYRCICRNDDRCGHDSHQHHHHEYHDGCLHILISLRWTVMMGCFCGCVKRRTRVWVEEVISLSFFPSTYLRWFICCNHCALSSTTTTSVPAIYLFYLPHCAPKPAHTGQHAICDVLWEAAMGDGVELVVSVFGSILWRLPYPWHIWGVQDGGKITHVFCGWVLSWNPTREELLRYSGIQS